MRANEKVAVAIVEDLKDWQKLNVVAFLASAIAIQFPDTHGKAFITASKSQCLGLFSSCRRAGCAAPLDRVGKLDRVWLLPVYSFSSATA